MCYLAVPGARLGLTVSGSLASVSVMAGLAETIGSFAGLQVCPRGPLR